MEEAHLRRRLDVLEVHQSVLREVHDLPEVVEQAFVALKPFEQFDQRLGPDLLVVLGGHLRDDLHVAAHVSLQEFPQAVQRRLRR